MVKFKFFSVIKFGYFYYSVQKMHYLQSQTILKNIIKNHLHKIGFVILRQKLILTIKWTNINQLNMSNIN